MENKKAWGKREFWGLGHDYDHQWYLTDAQRELQKKIIELCRVTIRPQGIRSDETYEFPRANLDALAEMGLLGLLVSRDLGGLGENHQCAAMVCETIARYGCPSTALVYVMHLVAVATIMFRHHKNDHLMDLMRRLDRDRLVGTISYSDATTGGHFWYALSSKCWELPNGFFRFLKFSSWATSSGFADFYTMQSVSPGFNGDYSDLTNFLLYANEVRGSTEDWSALGLHGNQSGPLIGEAVLKPERMIGHKGDGRCSNDECVASIFALGTSAVWNGIAMGSIDLAKRHVVSKTHGDVGVRVCDYPTIQSYFGEAVSSTNASRCFTSSLALAYDNITGDCDWSIHADPKVLIRTKYLHWALQVKYVSAKNVSKVVDTMLHACGGTGYKTELGVERLLRDAKAGWVMGPSNEIARGWVGKSVLLGFETIDIWNRNVDQRTLQGELRKMDKKQKRSLAESLLVEASYEASDKVDEFDFDNPLSSKVPTQIGVIESNGKSYKPALSPDEFTVAIVSKIEYLTKDRSCVLFRFNYPDPDMHSGCITGQYIELAIAGCDAARYISPVSEPMDYGGVEAVIRYESHGLLANYLKCLKIGDEVKLRGPCGGLEYHPNAYHQIVFLCGGIGITPAVQMMRSLRKNPEDKTRLQVFFQAKTYEELLLRTELDEATTDERIQVIYTLQDVDEAWSGSEGYIDYNFLHQRLPAPRTDGRLKVVICGGGVMITVCLNALNLLKFQPRDIYIYGPFAAEQVRSVYGRDVNLFKE